MKSQLLTVFVAVSLNYCALAQNFIHKPSSGISTLRYSSVQFADIDGDGDLDLFATGANSSYILTSKLYKNDGSGNFTVHDESTFIKTREGNSAFADVNGDGAPDLIVLGSTNAPSTKLYLNDGNGNFSLSPSSNFTAFTNGSIGCTDLDNDGDIDVVISGMHSSNQRYTEVYMNDGTGVFTLKNNSGLSNSGVKSSSIAFADVNGDGFKDMFLCGILQNAQFMSKLYLNDGTGAFTETPNVFTKVALGSASFADIDLDGDQDLLLVGSVINNPAVAQVYTNDGQGNFTLLQGTPFTGVGYGNGAFADVNDDGYPDVFVNGRNQPSSNYANIYLNNGATGGFTLVQNNTFAPTTEGAIAFADIDGDTDLDLLITGLSGNSATANVYLNNFVLGQNETSFQKASLYPNPVTDILSLDNAGDITNIAIYTISGQLVLSKDLNSSSGYNINCKDLVSGIYIVSLTTEKGIEQIKIIKE